MKTKHAFVFAVIIAGLVFVAGPAFAADKKPNIVVIWGDDIGQSDISAYSHGLMGFKTPNIDRVAKEGMMSPTFMPSRAALPAGHRSSPASPVCARA